MFILLWLKFECNKSINDNLANHTSKNIFNRYLYITRSVETALIARWEALNIKNTKEFNSEFSNDKRIYQLVVCLCGKHCHITATLCSFNIRKLSLVKNLEYIYIDLIAMTAVWRKQIKNTLVNVNYNLYK